jgi:hypothetical protein
MSKENLASGGDSEASGAGQVGDDGELNHFDASGNQDDKVAYSTYHKTLAQAKKARSENEELKQRLDQYEQEKLEAQKKYEDLYRKERELREAKEKEYKDLSKRVQEQTKAQAMQSELSKLGIDPKYSDKALKLVDLSDLHIDEMNNEVVGARDAAQRFREEYDVFFRQSGPKASHDAPKEGGSSASKPLDKMSVDELREYHKALKQRGSR